MTAPIKVLDHRMIVLSIVLLNFIPRFQVSGFICVEPNITTYLRSEGYALKEPSPKIVQDVTLHECASQCTESIECDSFQYDSSKLQCALSIATGEPYDAAAITPDMDSQFSLFQKICIQTSSHCPSPYAFERYARHLLVGNALEVVHTEGLSKCLSLCLEAKKALQIECRSVMYYYGTSECILNRESRLSLPYLFTNDTTHLGTDYFDNTCLDVSCSDEWSVHWIKVEPFAISDQSDVVLEGVTREECLQNCLENSVRGQQFPCKVFAYSDNKLRCHLTIESGINREREVLDESDKKIIPIVSENFYEKICLHGKPNCGDVSFECTLNHALANVSPTQVLSTSSVAVCLEACLKQSISCHAAMFFRQKDECVLTTKSQFTDPNQFYFQPDVDYYDNLCDYVGELDKPDEAVEEFPPVVVTHEPMKVQLPRRAHSSSGVIVQHTDILNDPVDKGKLETECRVNGIVLTVWFASKTTGSIYIKDHFSTCRADFVDATSAVLSIELPSLRDDNPPCPAREIKPSVWSFVVVVQRNDLDVPALMTDVDRVFNVSCDYSNIDISSVRAALQSPGEEANGVQLDEMSSERIRMTILRDSQPVSSVILGEELELRWTITRIDENDNVGFLVTECSAERLDGTAPYPPPVKLISNGCASRKVEHRLILYPITEIKDGFSTRIKAFKFDGSRRVRIRCAVDICEERCPQAICATDSNEVDEYSDSRKRRAPPGNDPAISATWMERKVLRQLKKTSLMSTFTIIEKDEEYHQNGKGSSEAFQNFAQSAQSLRECYLSSEGYVCVVRGAFVILIVVLTMLSAIQILQVLRYAYAHSFTKEFLASSGVSSGSRDSNFMDCDVSLSETGSQGTTSLSRNDVDYSLSSSSSSMARSISKQPQKELVHVGIRSSPEQSVYSNRIEVIERRKNAVVHKYVI